MRRFAAFLLGSELRVAFLFSAILLFGMCYQQMVDFRIEDGVDVKTYIALAKGNFEQSPTRRYRIVTPFLAAGMEAGIKAALPDRIAGRMEGDFLLKLSFFWVNLALAAAWCATIYRYLRLKGISVTAAAIGLLVVATNKWTRFAVAQPLVDMGLLFALGLLLLGITEKRSLLVAASLLIGPVMKEQYVFFIPLAILCAEGSRWKTMLFAAGGLLAAFSVHQAIDSLTNAPPLLGIQADLDHFSKIQHYASRFQPVPFFNDVVATIGLWPVIPLAAILAGRQRLRPGSSSFLLLYCGAVLVQMLLSGEWMRMLYMVIPIWALAVARAVDSLIPAVPVLYDERKPLP